MIDFLKKLNAEKFEDLVLGFAIYRPGPDKYIDELIKRKENNNLIKKFNIDDIRKKFLYGDSSLTESPNVGAVKNGVSEEIGELIFDEMVEHAPNAYSKSSAISETMSMYLSAYDKYHYSGVYFKYFLKQ